MSENPYRSPCETTKGEFDYSLTFRILRAVLLIVGVIAIVTLSIVWQHYSQINRTQDVNEWRQVYAFFFDWLATQD